MAISDAIKRKAESAIISVRNSTLTMEMQDNLVEAIESTKETTNGLTAEQKLQATTENQFMIVRLLAMHMISAQKDVKRTWKEVIVECKKEIMIVLVALSVVFSVLFALQPQLADHIDPIAQHMIEQQQQTEGASHE